MSGWFAAIARLPGNARGGLWMLAAVSLFAGVELLAKLLAQPGPGGPGLNPFQITLFRVIFGSLVVVPFLLRGPTLATFRVERWSFLVGRALGGYLAMLLSFYSVAHLPLADATALSFTRPLFMVPLAVVFLGELVRWRRWTATAVGFAGVVVMTRPGVGEINLAVVAAMSSAVFVAVVGVLIKKLAESERPAAIIFWANLVALPVALVPALFVWRAPTPGELGLLLLLGALGSAGQYLGMRAYRVAEATAVDPMDYLRLLLATLFGFAVFADVPDGWTLSGAAIIVAATAYIARREARLRRAGGA